MTPKATRTTPKQRAPLPRKCTDADVDRNRTAFPHALPFQVFFEEIQARRADDLAAQIRSTFRISLGEEQEWLSAELARSTCAYKLLTQSKGMNADNTVVYSNADEARCEESDANLLKLLHAMQTSALCFSGGGIRSASFCLGALQSMSRFGFKGEGKGTAAPHHMLCELDYLSTVSGGGYIGSWLMAWTKRLTDQAPGADAGEQGVASQAQKRAGADAFREVLHSLAGSAPHTTGDPAPRAIRHLRDYTSFLAPKLGLTLDTWTLVAIIFRNLFINWIMILPLLLCLIAFVQVLHFGIFQLGAIAVRFDGFHIAFGLATLLFMFAGTMAGLRMPSRQAEKLFASKLEPKAVFGLFVMPLAASSVLLLALWLQKPWLWNHPAFLMAWLAVAGWISFATIPIVRTKFTAKPNVQYSRQRRYVTGILAAAATGALLSVALYGIGLKAPSWFPITPTRTASGRHSAPHAPSPVASTTATPAAVVNDPRPEVLNLLPGVDADYFILFGFPIIWSLLMGASSLFSAFLSDYESDIDREWWARAGGMMMYTLIFWVVAMGIVIYAPQFLVTKLAIGKFSGAGFLTGALGALGGFSTSSGQSGSTTKKADTSFISSFLNRFGLVLPAVCCLALLALALLLAKFEVYLAIVVHAQLQAWRLAGLTAGDRSLKAHICVFIGTGIVALLANAAININIFSLHGMYRMRLMRAFLGSSNTRRDPDKFTGFDDRDMVWEDEVPCEPGVPLHLIQTTVNLVGTRDLAWAQRKAEGFTISPLHCGGWRLGYVPTRCYGGPRGLSLATAMAISGAAINPNMGYHSSPLVTLIMTLFNARLGWWLPNPKYNRKDWKMKWAKKFCSPMRDLMAQKSPRLALRPLIDEMFGGTNDTTPYIELTDGGHFEDLGVYEMVLRRSNRIIIIDAGADPDCEFEDLGNAIRKIEIDLGIPITFRGNKLEMEKGTQATNLRCGIADIHYECVDGPSTASGELIYIKAGMNGQEPADIRQYAVTHPTFPHEATSNQFFTESQFESYRHLGSFSVDQIVNAPDTKISAGLPAPRSVANMEAFFDRAKNYSGQPDAGKGISVP
ncbi:MAG TPA: hypothetical protein VFC39_14970 [Acidobacteriaceae bacterium]|nr:hypothetical protein [Acidobacteriaceae bacterium]